MPRRVQRTRKAGQPGIPPGAVYVGRGKGRAGRFGNPWHAMDYGREGATRRFREYLQARRNPHPGWADVLGYPSDDEIRRDLGGKDLACWCPLPAEGEPDHCHAAVLLQVVNGEPA